MRNKLRSVTINSEISIPITEDAVSEDDPLEQ